MCGWLSKLTRLSERNESSGRLPKTTTFRSRSQSLYEVEFWLPIIGKKTNNYNVFPPYDIFSVMSENTGIKMINKIAL